MKPNNEHPSLEQKSLAYARVWEHVLGWKQTVQATSPTGSKSVNLLSILTLPDDLATQTKTGPEKDLKIEILPMIAQSVADFADSHNLSSYTPSNINIILYPQHLHNDLFPGKKKVAGFHLRRGGYPVMLVSLTQKADVYSLQPFVVGHELGEIVVSSMLKKDSSLIGPMANIDHPLKEGFCNVMGLLYYNFLANQQGQEQPFTYDETMEEYYSRYDTTSLLNDTSLQDLTEAERKFIDYCLAGSVVSKLAVDYGLQKVLAYFTAEADNSSRMGRQIQQDFSELSEASQGLFSLSLNTEVTATPPDRPELTKLLDLLGYTPAQFGSVDNNTVAVDSRTEGAVAALVIDQFSHWYNRNTELEGEVSSIEVAQAKTTEPSFIKKVCDGISQETAKKIFGPDFSTEAFMENWKKGFIQKYG